MKIKTIHYLLFFYSVLMAKEVRINVVDETGVPISRADASIYFMHPRNDDQRDGITDETGSFSVSGTGSLGVVLMVKKNGYYPARMEGLSKKSDHNFSVVLPRVLNPIALYAWRSSGFGSTLTFPAQNQWFGFDFEEADWVAPYGKGGKVDILLRFTHTYKGWHEHLEDPQRLEEVMAANRAVYAARKKEWTLEKFKITAGRWDGVLEISFPAEAEGILEERRIFPYSLLKMPHTAPVEGYVSSWRFTSNNYSPPTERSDVGFFLRTRVSRGKDGKLLSANYAKVIGDFRLDAAGGSVEFSYYFNPVSNDRNLEFDPKKNLFPKSKPGSDVYDP